MLVSFQKQWLHLFGILAGVWNWHGRRPTGTRAFRRMNWEPGVCTMLHFISQASPDRWKLQKLEQGPHTPFLVLLDMAFKVSGKRLVSIEGNFFPTLKEQSHPLGTSPCLWDANVLPDLLKSFSHHLFEIQISGKGSKLEVEFSGTKKSYVFFISIIKRGVSHLDRWQWFIPSARNPVWTQCLL